MEKTRKIKPHIVAVVAIFLLGSTLMNPARATGSMNLLDLLLPPLFALALLLFFAWIYNKHPDLDFFEILNRRLGKVFGRLATLVFCIFAIFTATITAADFAHEISLHALQRVPPLLIVVLVMLLALYLTSKGGATMARISVLLLVAVLGIITVIIALSAHNYVWANLTSIGRIRENSNLVSRIILYGQMIIPFMLLPFIMREENERHCIRSSCLVGYGGGILLIVVMSFHNILILGVDAYASVHYPTVVTAGVIMAGDFLQRLEAFALGISVPLAVIKLSICLCVAAKGMNAIIGKKELVREMREKGIVLPAALVSAVIFVAMIFVL